MARQPKFITLDSSAMDGYEYAASVRRLTIHFKDGSIRTYHDVPRHVVQALRESSSKGAYFNAKIRDNYTVS